jgi:hypothetical protein
MLKRSKSMGPARRLWNEGIQKRVAVTSDVLGTIKEAKMLGIIDTWLHIIQDFRVKELSMSKKFRTLIMYMNVLSKRYRPLPPLFFSLLYR